MIPKIEEMPDNIKELIFNIETAITIRPNRIIPCVPVKSQAVLTGIKIPVRRLDAASSGLRISLGISTALRRSLSSSLSISTALSLLSSLSSLSSSTALSHSLSSSIQFLGQPSSFPLFRILAFLLLLPYSPYLFSAYGWRAFTCFEPDTCTVVLIPQPLPSAIPPSS